jgi:hypothetical protein
MERLQSLIFCALEAEAAEAEAEAVVKALYTVKQHY